MLSKQTIPRYILSASYNNSILSNNTITCENLHTILNERVPYLKMYQGVNGNVPKFSRTGSQICPSPEEELLEAVFNNNQSKIEQLLTRNESLLTHTYPDYDKRILLIACSESSINARTVEKLLNFKANPRDYTNDNGWEALHWAAQKTDYETLNVLLKRNPGDVNVLDQYENNALHILIRHGNRESADFLKCVILLIKKGINPYQVDKRNKTAIQWADKFGIGNDIRNIIEENKSNINSNEHTNNNLQNEKDDGRRLVNYLNERREESFIDFRNGDIGELVDYCDSNSTLLQICCRKNLTLASQHLLENGANPDLTGPKDSTKPVIIAAEHGFTDIFKSLLEKYDPISRIPEGLLASILQYIDQDLHNNMECYKVFIDRIKRDSNADVISLKLNEVDKSNNTALHYAIRYGNSDVIEELLNLGASLGAKNKYGVMPIQDIEPETLEKHLDSCVHFDLKSKKIEKEDFQVKFSYRSLIPPYAKINVDQNKDPEAAGMNSTIKKELVGETEVIFFMSKTSEFKHLLKHPVIVSFLFMKWRRIQWLFWTNLIFYFIFASSLLTYILSSYAYFSQDEKSTVQTLFAGLSYLCLIMTLFVLVGRELFQICVAPTNYFKNFENYIEIVLIVMTAMIVFISSPTDDTRKQLSSLSILLAAFELVLMLGQHPNFSTNVVMLRTVSFNFFKFLMWYSLLIIAFALSFYFLFTTNPAAKENNSLLEITNGTLEDDTDGDKSFDNPGKSVFKTIIMLTGEFDASDINFDTFPITSKLIFALFIFMIAIILLNLLNGLAVSDTQMIKNDAELVGHIARAQHIRYVESMLVGNVLPTNVMNKLSGICCCLPMSRKRNFRICNAFSKDASLFPTHLNYELIFYPNKYGLIELNGEEISLRKSCTKCRATYLDRDTIRRTNSIVQRKRNDNSRTSEHQIKNIEEELMKLQEKVNEILTFLTATKSSTY